MQAWCSSVPVAELPWIQELSYPTFHCNNVTQQNIAEKCQILSQAAASVGLKALQRGNLSRKLIRLSSCDLSLKIWMLSLICGFKRQLFFRITETNYHVSLWKTEATGLDGWRGCALKVSGLQPVCHYVRKQMYILGSQISWGFFFLVP